MYPKDSSLGRRAGREITLAGNTSKSSSQPGMQRGTTAHRLQLWLAVQREDLSLATYTP